MKKAVKVEIFGTVQGIFFRQFIYDNAENLGIKGYVRNKPDGSIEAWLEGDEDNVKKMIEVCKKGPQHAVIKRVDVVDGNFQGLKEFKILK